MNIQSINEDSLKVVQDFPGLQSTRSLTFCLNELIPFMEDSLEWLEAVKGSGLLTSAEQAQVRAFVYALDPEMYDN